MELHRQRFSQLNSKLKQRKSMTNAGPPISETHFSNTVLPNPPPRPLPRQQPRVKPSHQINGLPMGNAQRPNTANIKIDHNNTSPSDQKYITLANLTKILQMLQSQNKAHDHDTSTVMSTSTASSAKPRVQQHLQETAVRWWKPARPSDSPQSTPAPSAVSRFSVSTSQNRLPSSKLHRRHQQQRHQQSKMQDLNNLPMLTIVSNSARQNSDRTLTYDDSSSTEDNIDTTIVNPSILTTTKSSTSKLSRHEPLIMQTHGRRLQSYDQYKYQNPHSMNFLPQRLIRQT